jgi:glycosyltransferase domain-containing protein
MSTALASRVTICIATLNRPAFVQRTLRYYAETGFAGVILVGDGSVGEMAASNRDIVMQHAGRLRVEWIDAGHLSQPETFSLMADRVATDFAVYSGDDDYLVPEALAECEQFLDLHADFIAAHGTCVAINADGVHGIPASLDPYSLPNIQQEAALRRLEHCMMNYSVAIYAVHRSDAWREMFRESRNMADKAIGGEIAPCAISAVLGKCAQLTGLYLIRQIHPRRHHLPLQGDWVLEPQFAQSCKLLLSRIRALIAKLDESPPRDQIDQRTWSAVMGYVFRELHMVLPEYVEATAAARRRIQENMQFLEQGALLDGTDADARRYQAIYRSVAGERLLAPRKPRMLLSWGNPYVLDEAITPILPDLAARFSIILLLVDYRLSSQIRERAYVWKDQGLIDDVLVAPSHGGSFEAHLYMRQLLPAIRRLDFAVFLSISAMQPYERYLIECGLPASCLRILFWPHPTNLFLYPELGHALLDKLPPREIDAIVERIRRRIEPKLAKELWRFPPGLLGICRFLLAHALRKSAIVAWLRQFAAPGTASSTSRGPSVVTPNVDDGGSPLTRFLIRHPWIRPYGKRVTKAWPALRFWVEDLVRFAYRIYRRLKESRSISAAAAYGGRYGPWFRQWPMLARLNVSRTEQFYYYLLDRIIYPEILVGKRFPLKKLDWITQLGSDDFDACMFFNEQDTELHKILYANPNMYTVRYVARDTASPADPLNAVLLPFSIHAKTDLTPGLLEIYRRDLEIALRESRATEVHVRPHPGALEDWLDFLVAELRARDIPARLVKADRPLSEEAGRYKGVLSAVSGSLRDARLACPHIFVVGSVGLSLTNFQDPKRVVGFPDSIGWIEADGSYDPAIFRPAMANTTRHPSAAQVVVSLFEGRWERTPARLANPTGTAPAVLEAVRP